jgi:hypothetical protein
MLPMWGESLAQQHIADLRREAELAHTARAVRAERAITKRRRVRWRTLVGRFLIAVGLRLVARPTNLPLEDQRVRRRRLA